MPEIASLEHFSVSIPRAGRESLGTPAASSEKSILLKPEEVKWESNKAIMMPFMPQPEHENDQPEQQQNPAEDQPVEEESPAPPSEPEAPLPPEARGNVNGGPLGCCFGVSMGLLLSAGIASLSIPVISHFFAGHGLLALLAQILVIVLVVVGFFLLGFLGWKIGRRVFREYEPSPAQIRKMARLEQRYAARSQRKQV
jgi:hypothetical protein